MSDTITVSLYISVKHVKQSEVDKLKQELIDTLMPYQNDGKDITIIPVYYKEKTSAIHG